MKSVEIHKTKPQIDDQYQEYSIYEDQVDELAEIIEPSADEKRIRQLKSEIKDTVKPVYVYYPWKKMLLETVPEEQFFQIKTNRNQLLITTEEQKTLFNLKISIAGMSVGSSLLYGLVGSGFGNNFIVADDDIFSTSNLNRVQATVFDVGQSKSEVAYRRALEMNPFVQVKPMTDRITEQTADYFMHDGTASIVFEEIDDFRMKVVLREQAKKLQIPLVMLTNLGDSVLIDVERYDTEPETLLFNGNVAENLIENIKATEITDEVMKKLAISLVDPTMVPARAIESLNLMGSKLVGRPQLYGTVALDGGIAPYILRRIFLDNSLQSGRYSVSLKI